MPYGMVRVHLDEMDRIKALEHLEAVTVTAIGSGTMEADDSARIRDAWRREAGIPERQQSIGEIGAAAEHMHIRVVRVPKRRKNG